MRLLSPRQKEILGFIQSHISSVGYPPTNQEIADAFSFKSANGAREHLFALQYKGFLKITPNTPRGIVLSVPVPAKREVPACFMRY